MKDKITTYSKTEDFELSTIVEDILQNQDNYISTQIRGWDFKKEATRVEEYEWRGKLSVTQFSKHGDECCPLSIYLGKKFAKPNKFAAKTIAIMDLGKMVHSYFQEAVMNTPNLKWIKPYNRIPELEDKLEEIWPEVPLGIIKNGRIYLRGFVDDVINYYKEPVFIDYKSVNMDPVEFKAKFSQFYPQPDSVWQLKFYIFLEHLCQTYAPFKVKEGRLIYINTRMNKGDMDAVREVRVVPTKEDFEVYQALADEIVRLLLKDKEQTTIESVAALGCKYRFCKQHHGTDSRTKEEDQSDRC